MPEFIVSVLAFVLLEKARDPLVAEDLPVRIAPLTSNLNAGLFVPTPRFPAPVNRLTSLLFVFTTKSILSVVPTKFVPAVVPALPTALHALRFEVELNRAI